MRPPRVPFERLKVAGLLALLLYAEEAADPRPLARNALGLLLVTLIVIEVVRQVWAWGHEVSEAHVARSETVGQAWKRGMERIGSNTRWRIRRFLTTTTFLWLFGWVVNGMTNRCDDPFSCVVLTPQLLVENVPTILQVAVYIAIGMFQLFLMFWTMTKVGSYKIVLPGTITVTFDDVWGQDKAKARVLEQVELLESSEQIEKAGGYMPKGILLWGPPGTGKTMLAKAAANASTKPLILVPPGAFASTFVGINFLKVWSLFRLIRKLSLRYGGVICFIDEIDSLGNRGVEVADQMIGCLPMRVEQERPEPTPTVAERLIASVYPVVYGGFSGSNMGTLEAFLAAMDGMEQPRGFINKLLTFLGLKPLPPPPYKYLMIGATNIPDRLDAALTRAGRFGRKIHLPYPDYEGRVKTFEGYLGKIDHGITDEQIGQLARNMTRGTGAEIQDAVNEAVLVAFRDERDDKAVTMDDLVKALLWRKYGESDGHQEIEEDRWKVAVHEAGHAVVLLKLLGEYERIFFGSVEKRGRALGMIAPTEVAERPIKSRDAMLARVAVSLGSRAAEEVVLGGTTNGMGGDGPAATALARGMVQTNMMGGVFQNYQAGLSGRDFDERVEEVLAEAYGLAKATVSEHRDAVERIAALLVEKGTVLGDEIEEAMG